MNKERLQLENELLMTCSKAQAINKYIDELEENCKLSELWCKSQNNWNELKEWLEKELISNDNWFNSLTIHDRYCRREEYVTMKNDIKLVQRKMQDIESRK